MNLKFKEGEELISNIYPSYGAYTSQFFFAFVLASAAFLFLFRLMAQGLIGMVILGSTMGISLILVTGALKKRNSDVIIITNQRIVDIEKKGVFNKEISELKFDQIDDVTVRQKGMIPTLFRFGTLVIIGANGQMHLELQHVRNPMEVQDIILDLRQEHQDSKDRQSPKHEAHARLYTMVHELKYLTRTELKRLKQAVDGRMVKYGELKKKKKKIKTKARLAASEESTNEAREL